MEQLELLNLCSMGYKNVKMVQPLWKIDGQFLATLSIVLPYNPAIPLLHIYPMELKTNPHKNVHKNV